MYRYDSTDQQLINERVSQYRGQMERHLAGELSEDELRPLRLQNGLYIQRHGPMLRIAIPYGMLSSAQLRKLAEISRRYDRAVGHFTTRQNMQLNWPQFEETPEILAELASVEMHAVQTSGNCIRNITSDHFAGVAPDELVDPRPYCELLRQWSTFHPEFAFLPRKFKIAVNAAAQDRAVIRAHDIGLEVVSDERGEIGFKVLVGGGLGRTPILGKVVREFLPRRHILSYLEAIVRLYNRYGRRDNMYKARIKILVQALGIDEFARQVEAEWAHLRDGETTVTDAEFDRIARHFEPPAWETLAAEDPVHSARLHTDKAFANWVKRCVHAHKTPGYAAVTLSLKAPGVAPGDISDVQMIAVADLADRFSFGELRVSHEQNVILADVKLGDLHEVWQIARSQRLATANIGLLTDMICCPGGDLCSLANARSLPIAEAVNDRFDDLDYLYDIGDISLNISGCMNSCGHHHVANIGILGVDKNDEEWYQITVGGQQGNGATIGKVIGPSFYAQEVPEVIDALIAVYLEQRTASERFIDTWQRVGVEPFKARAYAGRDRRRTAKVAGTGSNAKEIVNA
ncbi:MAG: Sulfite reductase [ferredoxin] [Candidatus Accumulibacter regalis]|jgi:Sulfite reductase, beta subunit (hemoprotein)|uniref:Sulfite reductase [ferredoxin] n=1 Tax=Accumulibacter regalis TaxID=522306 RepID=A0A011NRQ3_ACCRE|nr:MULTISPECIES: nitrite/sulfite reductase [unclassified Candidatus Accumulibacter]EXI85403.1 MAG: Sulfite reductase [ferredoxin] [Candidatus Accumulibacter regalis]MQM33615.1 sulfite reductase [Candidatus Accumulibacter phosphatis]MBL8368810.1 nitrite/sulfite reductase [Accumulibacter sp.]MBN8514713.1 nitrite/sulfite reductase [Accumulibacter sp.]HRE70199.1 nitrite/sulfite reductase [Accumulibacter sp.]